MNVSRGKHQKDLVVTFLQRVAALAVDWLLATMLFGALLWAVLGAGYFSSESGSYQVSVPAILYAVYLLTCWLWQGTTPGMLLFGLRIVDAETRGSPHPWQWWIRGLGFIVALAPLGLGFLWALWDPQGRTWPDHIAGTLVLTQTTS